ncbi:MAG: type II toxin-antitoxin system VapC family toxin [Gemmatimonadales bacterium]
MKRLLLDTEALIWWDANDPRLGGNARALIQGDTEVYVSAASSWEITIKSALGKLRTSRRPTQAVLDAGFFQLPVTFEHTEAVGALPPHHNDPFDRLILAAAQVEGLTIVTTDRSFPVYGLPLVDARS